MTALAIVTTAADGEAARWDQWRRQYADSSRRTTTHMRLLFGVALLAVVAFLLRALLT